jgi:hypothetical protein
VSEAAYDPAFDPADFMTVAEMAASPNPYFPLVPGTRWVYAEGEDETIVVEVLDEMKLIEGVECRTVRDTVTINIEGEDFLVEDTLDWYAQDVDGNVWYCGEIVQNFEFIPEDGVAELVERPLTGVQQTVVRRGTKSALYATQNRSFREVPLESPFSARTGEAWGQPDLSRSV